MNHKEKKIYQIRRKRKKRKRKIKRKRKLLALSNKQPAIFQLLLIFLQKNLMLPLKQTKDSVSWKGGKRLLNSSSPTINLKDTQLTKLNNIEFLEFPHNNLRPRKLFNKSIYNIWERQLKFKDKSEDLLRELSNLEENWLIFVKSWKTIIEP